MLTREQIEIVVHDVSKKIGFDMDGKFHGGQLSDYVKGGADAVLKELRKNGSHFNDDGVHKAGTYVFIPDDDDIEGDKK